MNSSRTIVLITIAALIMLLLIPVQSMPTRQKRWTFNTWRLHGRRYSPHSTKHSEPNLEPDISSASTDVHNPDPILSVDNDDSDSYTMLLRLLQFFQMLEHEQNTQNNGNIYFSKDLDG